MKENFDIYQIIDLETKNGLNESQRNKLARWLEESPDHQTEYGEIQKVYRYSNRLQLMRNVSTPKDLQKVKANFGKGTGFKRIFINFQRVAAILIVPLLLFSVWSIMKDSVVGKSNSIVKSTETAFGVRSQIELSDGTKVWLNSGSKLFYPEEFNGKKREVKLIGEAYFQVQSDEKHPFYVDLGGFMIKATGTRFNINNYQDDAETTTFLESGKVSLVENSDGKEIQHGKLDAGQKIIVNKQKKKFKISQAEGEKYLSWINGKLMFRKDKMPEVARKLGHWFNAQIIIEDERLNDYLFTATFENESLEEALRLLSYSSPIEYKIINNSKLEDSSFTKRKVIIKKAIGNMN